MAVATYSQQAPLQGYYQWLQQQGLAACTTRQSRSQTVPTPAPSLPAGAYAQAGSLIRYSVLTTLSSVTVYFRGQFQTEAGAWQNVGQVLVGTSAGGIDQTILPATAGWYSNMVATVDVQAVTGTQVYVLVELGRTDGGTFLPYAVLLSGYITTNQPIDSSAGPQTQNPATSSGGGGCCLGRLFYDSGSGDSTLQYTVVVPSGQVGRVIHVSDVFNASAVVATRTPYFTLATSGGTLYESLAGKSVVALGSYGFIWQAGGARYDDTVNGQWFDTIPSDVWSDSDIVITLQVSNPQAGDDWLTADITYELKGP